jgi:hypothetical protein
VSLNQNRNNDGSRDKIAGTEFATSNSWQKKLNRFWIEISAVIIVLALINGVILGFVHTTQQGALKAASYFSESEVRLTFMMSFFQNKKWPTLEELNSKLSGKFTVDPSYTGISTTIFGHTFLIPTYMDFACSKKTSYFPEANSYVHCIGRAYQIS